jgi:FkbM family methyltransferase
MRRSRTTTIANRFATRAVASSRRAARLGRVLLRIHVEYRYRDFSIMLPPEHMLPVYRSTHPNYDRFLPHLAKHIDPGACIVDVGANVGDTLAGMVETNAAAVYVCIEPDESFFELLSQNIQRIKANKPSLAVITDKHLVGKAVSGVQLEGSAGSKHAVISSAGTHQSKPLDDILNGYAVENVRLVKSDVDGFDYDVLDSASSTISTHKPLLFFECQTDHAFQKQGYETTLRTLEAAGYTEWVLFDNFGAVLLRANAVDHFVGLLEYIWKQNLGQSTRTIFYIDILAAVSADKPLVDAVMAGYA